MAAPTREVVREHVKKWMKIHESGDKDAMVEFLGEPLGIFPEASTVRIKDFGSDIDQITDVLIRNRKNESENNPDTRWVYLIHDIIRENPQYHLDYVGICEGSAGFPAKTPLEDAERVIAEINKANEQVYGTYAESTDGYIEDEETPEGIVSYDFSPDRGWHRETRVRNGDTYSEIHEMRDDRSGEWY